MTSRSLREADAVSAAGAASLAGLDGVEGTWVSSDERTDGIPAVRVAIEDGKPVARVFGVGPNGWVDWGAAAADAVFSEGPGSPQAAGFVVRYRFGETRADIQVNFKIGVAVAGVFVQGRDAAGARRALFWREFLAQGEPAPGNVLPIDAAAAAAAPEVLCRRLLRKEAGEAPSEVITGRWLNTRTSTKGIPEVRVEPRGGGVALRLWGTAPDGLVDWGETRGEVFGCIEEDDQVSVCALARYDFDFMDSEIQVRQNKGVLAVTTFNRFKDHSSRFDYVTRELYYRTASEGRP